MRKSLYYYIKNNVKCVESLHPLRNKIITDQTFKTTSSTTLPVVTTVTTFASGITHVTTQSCTYVFTRQYSVWGCYLRHRCIIVTDVSGTNQNPAARNGRKTVRRPVMIIFRGGYIVLTTDRVRIKRLLEGWVNDMVSSFEV